MERTLTEGNEPKISANSSLPVTDKNDKTETNSSPSVGTHLAETGAETGGKPAVNTSSAPVPTSPTKPSLPITSLAAKVNAAVGAGMKIPAGLKGIDTSKLPADHVDYFHGMIYAETSARKSTTAAKMFGKENTIIILCRQPEQLIPLRGAGYKVLHAQDDEALVFALMYPEKAAEVLLNWPEWASLPNRALVFDDVTEGITLLLERNSTNDKGEDRKDMRQVYKFAGEELRGMFQTLRRKKLHLILIALAKVTNNDISNEEVIMPDLPPSMTKFISTDLEFVFFIDKSKWKFVTDSVYRSYSGTAEKGKPKTFRREIFGKNKLPLAYIDKRVFPATNEVKMDLARIWQCVKIGTPIEQVETTGQVKK
jgi:hypothetical protein